MFGGEHEVRGTKERVGPGGEALDLATVAGLDREANGGARAAPDPVALHDLDRLGPLEEVEVPQEPVGILGDPQLPLLEGPLEYRVVAPFAATLGGDLLVGEDGPSAGHQLTNASSR